MRGEDWEEVQGNRKWENRDGWRFLCNIGPYLRKLLKNDDDNEMFYQERWDFHSDAVFISLI